MSVPHPIPYQGSKRQIASVILRYVPENTHRLVEPFAGSGAVSLAAASQQKIKAFWLNDINAALMGLWQQIISNPEKLSCQYEKLWQMQQGRERHFYDVVRTRFNRTHHPYYFLYLLARCVKGSVRYNAQGEFNQSPDNRRKGRQPKTMRQDIFAVAHLLKNRVRLTDCDFRKVLCEVRQDDVVYFDPPYQGVSATSDPRYIQGIDHDAFVYALTELNTRNIPYIVSYDGRTGSKQHGKTLPDSLELQRIEIDAGRSSQATLLGRTDRTVESIYLSPGLAQPQPLQLSFVGEIPSMMTNCWNC